MNSTKWLGHEFDENGVKPNEEKVKAILKLKSPENTKDFKSFRGAIQFMANHLPKFSDWTDRLRNLLKKNEQWKWGPEQETDFNRIKQMLTEGPCLAHYAKEKENIGTTDASTTGLGITLWQNKDDGNTKPISHGGRYLNGTGTKSSISELEILAVVWGLEKFRFYLYEKKIYLYTNHQPLELLIKRNRSNKQNSARLTRWLDRLTHFDISIQHIAGSNLIFIDYLSGNPVGRAMPEENYDEEYVLNKLTELNLKYGILFVYQSENSRTRTETENGTSEEQNEKHDRQSHSHRIFEKEYGVNKIQQSKRITSGQSEISTPNSSCIPKENSKIVQNKNASNSHTEWTKKTFIIRALHAKLWTSSVDGTTVQKHTE